MLEKKVKIVNKLGLHARASMQLIKCAERFGSEIILIHKNREVNCKSIMNLMALGIACHTEIHLRATGEDEEQAMQAVCDLIADRFGEAE